jgi:outer membrane protein insertion porin family
MRLTARQHADNLETRGRLCRWLLVAVIFAIGGVLASPAGAQTDPRRDLGDQLPQDGQQVDEEPPPEAVAPEEAATVPDGQPATEGQTVDVVQVVGNRRVESDSILQRVQTEPGQPLDLEQISQDIQRAFDLGYFSDIQVDATVTQGDRLVVSFIVEEKPAIAEIRYVGNDELGVDEIQEVVDLERFAILDISKVQRNAQKIRDLYAEQGYYLAEVDYEIAEAEGRADLAVITFNIQEYAKVQVKKITFLGNENLADDELAGIMATREGSYFSFLTDFGTFQEEAFEADLQRLTAFYYNHGYVQVNVSRPSIRLSRDKRYLYVTISIEEGEQYFAGSIDIQGDMISDKDELLELVNLETGDVFDYGRMRQDIERVRNLYRNAGYAYVNVNPLTRIDKENNKVDLTYDIQQGNKVYLGRIEIAGNRKTRDYVIRREMEIEEGELFSAAALEASKRQIRRLGYFDQVEVTTQRGARDDLINVLVQVNETRTGTFQVGAGFSSTESFIANAQISQNNLLGRGQSLSFQAQLSSIRTLFNLKFSEPWLLGSRWNFSFDLYNFEYAFQDFTRQSTGGNLTFGYPISEAFELKIPGDLVASLTYKLENVDVTAGGQSGTNAGATGSLFGGGLTSSVQGGVFYDTRNNRLFPSEGSYHSAKTEFADRSFTLSQNEFLKVDMETRWYFPLFWEFVLRLQGELGYVTNLDAEGTVPLFERYFVGGPTTVRGFERYSLGPIREVANNPNDPASGLDEFRIGGNKRLIFTAEIEFPIFTAAGIKGVLFTDMGNAFDNDQPLTLVPDLFAEREGDTFSNALRTSVGFGFRWLSPIAPLRFEWGIPLERLRGEQPVVFDFSIGNAF